MSKFVSAGLASAFALTLVSCGGEGSSGGVPPVSSPAPSPSSTPTPTPPPTPTPVTANVDFIHAFGVQNSDARAPSGSLLLASDGNLYGTSQSGGSGRCSNGCGTVFRIDGQGAVSVVYDFDLRSGGSPAGYSPTTGLMQGSDGALYGTTSLGGEYGLGVFYRLSLNGQYSILHNFGRTLEDGVVPDAIPIQASDGNFYGTTSQGGVNCSFRGATCGTFYRVTPTGQHTVMRSFPNVSGQPIGLPNELVEVEDGWFYGTSAYGGNYDCEVIPEVRGCGTVFRIRASGELQVLHVFSGGNTDGAQPDGKLYPASDGSFFGITRAGGGGACDRQSGCGTFYRVDRSGSVTILYRFALSSSGGGAGVGDGFYPKGTLAIGSDGNFYGTTQEGGVDRPNYSGTVFQMTPAGRKTTLFRFGEQDANHPTTPFGGLVRRSDGTYWGILLNASDFQASGSRTGLGVVYRMKVQ